MDQDQQRDYAEESYNWYFCPVCDSSPCIGGKGKGSCDDDQLVPYDRYKVIYSNGETIY